MVAGIINTCGAFGGNMSGPTKNNQKGMFENAKIRNTIVKPYLESIGADKLGQYPLPDMEKVLIPVNWRKRIESVMVDEGYKRGPWFYKGAKMCLFWPVWHHAFENAKWVIVRRKDEDIVNSCVRTGFMRAFSRPEVLKEVGVKSEVEGWQWWVDQHHKRFIEMVGEGLNVQMIWPERMVRGDYSQIRDMIEWLGLEWRGEEVAAFIEPKLFHSRKKQKGG